MKKVKLVIPMLIAASLLSGCTIKGHFWKYWGQKADNITTVQDESNETGILEKIIKKDTPTPTATPTPTPAPTATPTPTPIPTEPIPQGMIKSDITGERARANTYRYVGVPHAKYITKHGLCLEEYIEQLKGYTIEKPLEVEGDGCAYRIYYVPLPASDKIEVFVPEKDRYTVSGNNCDGFIVTVTTK